MREFIGHRWIPLTKASDTELWSFFDLRLNKRLSNQLRRRRFETPSCSLWRHCNDLRNGVDLCFLYTVHLLELKRVELERIPKLFCVALKITTSIDWDNFDSDNGLALHWIGGRLILMWLKILVPCVTHIQYECIFTKHRLCEHTVIDVVFKAFIWISMIPDNFRSMICWLYFNMLAESWRELLIIEVLRPHLFCCKVNYIPWNMHTVVLCFVVITLSATSHSYKLFTHIIKGCFTARGQS